MNKQNKTSKILKIVVLLIVILVVLKIGQVLIYSYNEGEANRGRAESYQEYLKDKPGSVGYQYYSNDRFNFFVNYPDTWNIKDITMSGEGNSDLWLHIQNNTEEIPFGSNKWKTASYVDIQVSPITPKNEKMFLSYIQNPEKIILGGKQYDARIYGDHPFDLNSTEAVASRTYLIHGGNLYVLSYSSANKDEYIKNKETLANILSSFTFKN